MIWLFQQKRFCDWIRSTWLGAWDCTNCMTWRKQTQAGDGWFLFLEMELVGIGKLICISKKWFQARVIWSYKYTYMLSSSLRVINDHRYARLKRYTAFHLHDVLMILSSWSYSSVGFTCFFLFFLPFAVLVQIHWEPRISRITCIFAIQTLCHPGYNVLQYTVVQKLSASHAAFAGRWIANSWVSMGFGVPHGAVSWSF